MSPVVIKWSLILKKESNVIIYMLLHVCAENEVKAQASLDALSEYCKSNGLKVNITKSKVMAINFNEWYSTGYIHKSGKM